MFKRRLSILCTLALLVSIFPNVAFAQSSHEATARTFEKPSFLTGVPDNEWSLLEEDQLTYESEAVEIDDVKAGNERSGFISHSDEGWSLQLWREILPTEGLWDIYVKVRIESDDTTVGPAFRYGYYDQAAGVVTGDVAADADLSTFADNEYHYVKFGKSYEYDMTKYLQYYYFMSFDADVYVDHIILVRKDSVLTFEKPAFLENVPTENWRLLEDEKLTVHAPAVQVEDPHASNGSAIKVEGKQTDWVVQLTRD